MALHSCLTPSCRRKDLTTAAWISFWSKQYRRELIWTSSTQLIKSTVRSCPHIVNDLPQAGDTSEAIPSHVGDPTLDGEAFCFQIDCLSSRSRHSVMAQKLTSGAYQRISRFAATRSTSRVISSFSTLPFSLASFDQYWYRVLGNISYLTPLGILREYKEAENESSHMSRTTLTIMPFMKIRGVTSSMARLESPVKFLVKQSAFW